MKALLDTKEEFGRRFSSTGINAEGSSIFLNGKIPLGFAIFKEIKSFTLLSQLSCCGLCQVIINMI
jgi:hypothetical protein